MVCEGTYLNEVPGLKYPYLSCNVFVPLTSSCLPGPEIVTGPRGGLRIFKVPFSEFRVSSHEGGVGLGRKFTVEVVFPFMDPLKISG